MADTITLQDQFHAGVRRDNARDQVPRGGLWWSQDMLPNVDARLRERGGYTNASDAIAGVFANADLVGAGIYAPFSAAGKNLAIAEDSGVSARLIEIASNGTCTDIGALSQWAIAPLAFHRDVVILTGFSGGSAPQKYNGSAISSLGGSPPSAIYGGVFNDRTLLARTAANPNRLWFSDPGDPEGWDTTNTYWDFSFPIKGLASLRTAILVFHDSYTSRLRGTTPPPGTDFFADDPMWPVGCTDARSIATWNDRVIFANAEGIYVTDGAGLDDLTARCGVAKYWRETLAEYSSTWTIGGGVLRDHYIFTVMDGSTFKASAAIDLRRLAYWPMTNLDMRCTWPKQGLSDELYFGRRGAARVGGLSSVFMPTSTVKNDGDGDAVAGLIETPFYRGKPSTKGWRRLFTSHYLRDYASDNPTVQASYVTTPEATSYTNLASAYSETSGEDRKPLPLGFRSRGVAFKYTRANAGDWQLNAIEADVHTGEASR